MVGIFLKRRGPRNGGKERYTTSDICINYTGPIDGKFFYHIYLKALIAGAHKNGQIRSMVK